MTGLLIKLIQKKHSDTAQRSVYATLSSKVCIFCNLLLAAIKFAVGIAVGSVSVTADGVNNLSDSLSNVVTLTGTRLSDKPDDKEHPFGHGRAEYITALILAVSIFAVGIELAKSSVEKIISPAPMKYGTVYIVLLLLTVLVKLWMAFFNGKLYKLTDNLNLKAVRQDSLNDCLATAAAIVSLLLSHFLHWQRADGITGICVSAFVFYSGAGILKQVLSPLLGEAPDSALTQRIEEIITRSDIVYGVHDLVIHSYGANKRLASADAEVDARADIFAIHGAIDEAERTIREELGVEICIHMDPVDKADTETEAYRLLAEGIIKDYNSAFSLHDFMLTEENGKKNVRFDLAIPYSEDTDEKAVQKALTEQFVRFCPHITVDFRIEHK